MKKLIPYSSALFLAGFGVLTLFLSTSVILDLFDIRAREGNYVLFVVWSNFISSILYLFAAYGFIRNKKWTTVLLGISTIILITAFIGLNVHMNSGGIYEEKTFSAMIFRTGVTLVFTIIAFFTITKNENMKSIIMSSVLLIALFAVSCDNSSKNGNVEATIIELNNGQKWDVNTEMIPFVLDGEKILSEFKNGDYKELADQLEAKNQGLIKSCTMEGKSHDELHKWLHPHLELVKELANTKSEEKANELVSRLEESYKSYNLYFK